jgi:hypothetical protein|tara:strand:- start:412 stop:540 length:129 start_codon:yes stop_codon:yes gene_type:complete
MLNQQEQIAIDRMNKSEKEAKARYKRDEQIALLIRLQNKFNK